MTLSPDNSPIHDAIVQAAANGFEDQTAFLEEFARLPSLRFHEDAAQDFMAEALTVRGWQVDDWTIPLDDLSAEPGYCPAPGLETVRSVVGTKNDNGDGRSLILQGHLDVVPTGPEDMWRTPPFDPVIRNGWMHGRGAGDMKSGTAAALFAMDAIERAGFSPAARVHFQSVVEEESTGMGALATLARGYRADCVLIPEPTDHKLVRAQVGVLWFHLHFKGRPVHVSDAGQGANAIMAAYLVIGALERMAERWNAVAADDPWFGTTPHPLNFNIGRISGGDWASSVPAWCTAECRMGLLPGTDVEMAKAEIRQVITDVAKAHPFLHDHPPEIIWSGFQAPGWVLKNAKPAEAALAQAYMSVFKEDGPRAAAFTALTDTRFYGLYHGIPSLCFGPRAEGVHGFDERVDLDSVQRCTETIALFIANWCGLTPR